MNGLRGKIELYRINEDIGEENDLAAKYPELVSKVEKIMLKEHAPHPVLELSGYKLTEGKQKNTRNSK